MKLKKGLIQTYTGYGKGKTTAAIGQGVRSSGNGLKVYMIQFLKTSETGELKSIEDIKNFTVFRFESNKKFFWDLNEKEKIVLKSEVQNAINFIKDTLQKQNCDVLILDEVFGAISNGLINTSELIDILKDKPNNIEIIMTGRDAPDEIIEISDYVSEIRMIKHPFDRGISSRRGIEY